jgi:hypothetical protein
MKIMPADVLLQLRENVRGPIAESVYATGCPSLTGASHG